MARYDPLNDADQGFFDTLLGDGQAKTAAELSKDTFDALGIPSVSPSILDQLEAQAAETSSGEESPQEQAPAPPPPDQEGDVQSKPEEETQSGASVAVDEFKREDNTPEGEVETAEPELPSRSTHGKLFSDKRAHPLQIFEVLTMRYKGDWVEWESDTLWWSLRRSFGAIGELSRNKIMALRLAATTDMPWIDWDIFEDCGLCWNDIVPTIGAFQPMTPMQLAFAIQVLREVRGDEEFNHEVKAYIAAILDDHGWVWAPPEYFGDVQEILERGREHQAGLKQDVASAWEKLSHVDPQTIEWTDEEALPVHLMKLFAVKSYLDGRAELREEVPGAPSSSTTVSPPVP